MPFVHVFHNVFVVWLLVAVVVFALVTGVLLVAVVRNRAGKRERRLFGANANMPLELGFVVVLAGIVAALVTGSFQANDRDGGGVGLTRADDPRPPVHIDVSAYRWCWNFTYRQAPISITGQCEQKRFPTVVVPAGQPVDFALSSRDVVHSFWLPDFNVKRDANPGSVNNLRMSFPHEGTWKGRCSEYCGTHHVTMDFFVKVVSPSEYQQYLDSGGASA